MRLMDPEIQEVREDLRERLDRATTPELLAIQSALAAGRVYGGSYYGECSCLLGSILNHRWAVAHPEAPAVPINVGDRFVSDNARAYLNLQIDVSVEFDASAFSPMEHYAVSITPGDTPESSRKVANLHAWVGDLIAERGA